ncbi:hypothetical protein QOZ80_3AG0234910 [Eleusine coracana subsp. coracana]|nr:hypothetical protein QOZ80_3AG0234910 [Eleusine coracana subsp. coracana]
MMAAAPPAQFAGVQPPPSSSAGATATKPAPAPPLPRAPRVQYTGVQRSPCGQWTAHVVDPDQHAVRAIGPFPDEHAAALAHDRVAIAFHGGGSGGAGGRLNFGAAFHAIEHKFLVRCGAMRREEDVCAMVADGSYEARYAAFLRAVFALERYGEFMDVILEFYIDRAAQVGEDALLAGGEKLVARFVAMHRNKAINPGWRDWYHRKIAQCIAERQQKQFAEQKASYNSSSTSTVLSGP